jgi:hypothetical protein
MSLRTKRYGSNFALAEGAAYPRTFMVIVYLSPFLLCVVHVN